MGFLNGAVLLALAVMVDQQLRRRRREAPDRPADADAGKLVGELVQLNREFIAKSPDGAGAPFVQIDGRRAIVAFHNLAFVSAFVGNPILPMVELPFPEILSAIQDYSKGHSFLTVRTTRGKVVLHDSLHPFQTLADVLSDIVELNRTSPEAYAAALAREPKIHTPWYGWLIFATAVGSILYLGWKFMHQ
jgi:hypothetical protein